MVVEIQGTCVVACLENLPIYLLPEMTCHLGRGQSRDPGTDSSEDVASTECGWRIDLRIITCRLLGC